MKYLYTEKSFKYSLSLFISIALLVIFLIVPYDKFIAKPFTDAFNGQNNLWVPGISSAFTLIIAVYTYITCRRSEWSSKFLCLVAIVCMVGIVGIVVKSALDLQPSHVFTGLSINGLALACGMLTSFLLKDLSYRIFPLVLTLIAVIVIFRYLNAERHFMSGSLARAVGPYENVTTTACVLTLLVCLSVTFECDRYIASIPSIVKWIALLTSSLAILLTFSRTAGLAVFSGVLTIGVLTKWNLHMKFFFCITLLLVSLIYSGRHGSDDTRASTEGSNAGRIAVIRAASERIKQSWPNGEGLNSEPITIINPKSNKISTTADPHNLALFIVSKFGMIGVLLGILLTSGLIYALFRKGHFQPQLYGTWASFAILSVLETPVLVDIRYSVTYIFGILLGLTLYRF